MANLSLVNGMRRHVMKAVARIMASCQPDELPEVLNGLVGDLKNLAAGRLPEGWPSCVDREHLERLQYLHPWSIPGQFLAPDGSILPGIVPQAVDRSAATP